MISVVMKFRNKNNFRNGIPAHFEYWMKVEIVYFLDARHCIVIREFSSNHKYLNLFLQVILNRLNQTLAVILETVFSWYI
jgi:hypothetical protein